MRLFSGLLGFLILLLVVSFILSNRQEAAVALWPLAGVYQTPLYLLGLAPLALGLVLGGAWGWMGAMRQRLRAKRLNKELTALNDKIHELQKAAIVQQAKPKPSRPFWSFHK